MFHPNNLTWMTCFTVKVYIYYLYIYISVYPVLFNGTVKVYIAISINYLYIYISVYPILLNGLLCSFYRREKVMSSAYLLMLDYIILSVCHVTWLSKKTWIFCASAVLSHNLTRYPVGALITTPLSKFLNLPLNRCKDDMPKSMQTR